jgi:hypothetical protein
MQTVWTFTHLNLISFCFVWLPIALWQFIIAASLIKFAKEEWRCRCFSGLWCRRDWPWRWGHYVSLGCDAVGTRPEDGDSMFPWPILCSWTSARCFHFSYTFQLWNYNWLIEVSISETPSRYYLCDNFCEFTIQKLIVTQEISHYLFILAKPLEKFEVPSKIPRNTYWSLLE